jgi:hypothetical protein
MVLLAAGQFITMSEDLQPTVSAAESVRSVAREAVEVHTHKAGLVRMRSVGTVGLVFRTVSLVQLNIMEAVEEEVVYLLLGLLQTFLTFPVGLEEREDRVVEVRAPDPPCTTTLGIKKQTWFAVKTEHRIQVAVAVAARTLQVQGLEPTSEIQSRYRVHMVVLESSSFVIRQLVSVHPTCRISTQVSRRVRTVQTQLRCTIHRRVLV